MPVAVDVHPLCPQLGLRRVGDPAEVVEFTGGEAPGHAVAAGGSREVGRHVLRHARHALHGWAVWAGQLPARPLPPVQSALQETTRLLRFTWSPFFSLRPTVRPTRSAPLPVAWQLDQVGHCAVFLREPAAPVAAAVEGGAQRLYLQKGQPAGRTLKTCCCSWSRCRSCAASLQQYLG